MITLTDNSKIIVYASSPSGAEVTARNLAKLVQGSKVPKPLVVKIGERKGEKLKSVNVVPIRASYFPKGQQETAPEWVEKLR